jgi:thiol-disulfide isomerase/thioredoxin
MKRRDFLRDAAFMAGAAGLGLNALPALAAGAPGDVFAQTLPDAAGGMHKLADLLGKPVVVNFWATWCPPCVKEMPDLQALHTRFDSVNFVGLAVDTGKNVQAFIKKIKVSYPLLIIGNDGIPLMRSLGNQPGGLPFTVVFDAKGQMKSNVLGEIKPDALSRLLQGMVA